MPTILDEIIAVKRNQVATARRQIPYAVLEAKVAVAKQPREFAKRLNRGGAIQLIAEIKKASPSAGVLRSDFNPAAIARIYEKHGAACLSVLTDTNYFQGSLDHLTEVADSVRLPLLRKDFFIDEYQVLEARAAGADAVLLIAEVLNDRLLAELLEKAKECGMAAIVELHDAENLPRVLASGTELIGINNRDLRHFHTDVEHTLRLRDKIPSNFQVVSESGIFEYAQLSRLEAAGVSAVLVGESLMRAPDIGAAVDRLLGKGV